MGASKYAGWGESKYPIHSGAVFRLHEPRRVINPEVDGHYLDHDVFLWIHTVAKYPPIDRRPKFRKVGLVEILVPKDEPFRAWQYCPRAVKKTGKSSLQFETVCRLLYRGYDRLKDVRWSGRQKKAAYAAFYKRIGIL